MEDITKRSTATRILHVKQRVSGAIKDEPHQRLYGHIISAIGEWKYLVRFDNGSEKECSSAVHRVEKMHTNVPSDIQMPMETTLEHRIEIEKLEEEVVDQEEEEPHGAPPDEEEMEKVSGDAAQDNGDQPNGIC
jgi:hypothetical protein